MPASVTELLARLAPDQRAAATAPPGPVLCIAPAGSGKTTTLVARVAWLIGSGVDPAEVCAITFNTRAAEELRERLRQALAPLGSRADDADGAAAISDGGSTASSRVPTGRGVPAPGGVRVRTFHALGLEILRDAGRPLSLVSRDRVLRAAIPAADAAERRRLDDAFSRLKLDLGVTAEEIAADPSPGPVARAFLAYQTALATAGASDFDDLVAGALRTLEADPGLLARWRARCAHLLVDEVQDVDRSQLRLALLLASPANRIFLVGDDDQSIYGWRLADVRRVLGLAAELPGLQRVDLAVNYRCPAAALARAVRLVEHNVERFAKEIRAGPGALGRLVLAPLTPDEPGLLSRLLAAWPDDGGRRAVLARTRRELRPLVGEALALGVPFRADGVALPLDDPRIDPLVAAATADRRPLPAAARVAMPLRGSEPAAGGMPTPALASPPTVAGGPPAETPLGPDDPEPEPSWTLDELRAALVGWAVALAPGADLAAEIAAARVRLAALRTPDAALTLATAHGTKGLEWDHVAVVGLTEGRFPSARSLAEAADPVLALEEERRLAYVAWTRPRRSLTLVYDPEAPSPFLREAFDSEELDGRARGGREPPVSRAPPRDERGPSGAGRVRPGRRAPRRAGDPRLSNPGGRMPPGPAARRPATRPAERPAAAPGAGPGKPPSGGWRAHVQLRARTQRASPP
jgi:superfamily I DNA/RNA helicase